MNIPFEFTKNNKYYIFIEKCNEDLYLYEVYDLNRKELNYKETFKAYDLGLVEQTVERPRLRKNMNIKP